ncbi:DUF6011 domain-containing protein [Streptomyces sp. TR06-5]|uniref:DUF6011 domain-containing protein n=1 Tax=unclassified Streptomyces TaxID=2593676 RepID=UPI0039A04B33
MTDALLPLPDASAPGEADVDGQGPRVTCGMCGAPLRDRTSRLWGLGRDCRRKLELRAAPAPPRVDVEQDTLPGM